MSINDMFGGIVRQIVGIQDERSMLTLLRAVEEVKKAGSQGFVALADFTKTLAAKPVAVTLERALLVTVNRAAPFDPAKEIGAGWAVWRGPIDEKGLKGAEEQDSRALARAVFDLSEVIFETTLKDGEKLVIGEEKLKRLVAGGNVRLDAAFIQALWVDYQKDPPSSTLEWLHVNRGINFLDGMGTILRNPNGNRYVLYLYRSGSKWYRNCNWLDNKWNANNPSATLAK